MCPLGKYNVVFTANVQFPCLICSSCLEKWRRFLGKGALYPKKDSVLHQKFSPSTCLWEESINPFSLFCWYRWKFLIPKRCLLNRQLFFCMFGKWEQPVGHSSCTEGAYKTMWELDEALCVQSELFILFYCTVSPKPIPRLHNPNRDCQPYCLLIRLILSTPSIFTFHNIHPRNILFAGKLC